MRCRRRFSRCVRRRSPWHYCADLCLVADKQAFFVQLWQIKQRPSPPLRDLAALALLQTDPDSPPGAVHAERFVAAFTTQMKDNFERLEALPMANLKKHLGAHSKVLRLLLEHVHVVAHVGAGEAHVRAMKELQSLKEELLELIIMARAHVAHLRELVRVPPLVCVRRLTCVQLEPQRVHCFAPDALRLVAYFQRWDAHLDRAFATAAPTFPLELPMFTLLQEGTFTLTKQEEFDAVKGSYADMKKTFTETISAFPSSWPQTLPNLGTHDTQPAVRARSSLRCVAECVRSCASQRCPTSSASWLRTTSTSRRCTRLRIAWYACAPPCPALLTALAEHCAAAAV